MADQMVCRRGHVTELDGPRPPAEVIGELGACPKGVQVGQQIQVCGLTAVWKRSRPTIRRVAGVDS